MLEAGITIAQKRRVVEPDCITFLGGPETLTLSTPAMITWMEIASRELVKPHLPSTQNTVGVHLNVYHLQPVRVGALAVFHSKLLRVDGRRYERQAVRVTEPGLFATLSTIVAEKYGLSPETEPEPDDVWFFRMDPPGPRG